MVVLGIDTATWTAAVGVARDGVVLAESVSRAERSHTASLPRLIDEVLARAELDVAAIEAIAVSIGPGSFTGLRIGLGVAKGLAWAGGCPLVAVPTLEVIALAAQAEPGRRVWAAIDARMREVYAASFSIRTPTECTRLTDDEAMKPDDLARRLENDDLLVGDARDAYAVLGSHERAVSLDACSGWGGLVAVLGARRLAAGEAGRVEELEPAYVRPPQAELPKPPL